MDWTRFLCIVIWAVLLFTRDQSFTICFSDVKSCKELYEVFKLVWFIYKVEK